MNVIQRNRMFHAFTLVELLVVIEIIALLVSMLLPALNKTRFTAQTSSRSSNGRPIQLAIIMYAADNQDGLPRFAPTATTVMPGVGKRSGHDLVYRCAQTTPTAPGSDGT